MGIDDGSAGPTRRDVVRYGATGAAVLGAGGLIAACGDDDGGGNGGEAPAAKAKQGGDLRLAIVGGSENTTVDGQSVPDAVSYGANVAMYNCLYQRDANFELFPALAEELTPNGDGTVWTARLREGVEWHDGKPLTAADVIFTIKRAQKEKNQGASVWSHVDAAGLKAIDDRTVEIPLTAPNAVLTDIVANPPGGIVPEGYDVKKPIGTGPFKLTSVTPGQELSLARFDNYWGEDAAKVDTVVLTGFADNQAAVNALQSGQVDGVETISVSQGKIIAGAGGTVVSSPGGSTRFLNMRVDVKPFDDIRVRDALKLIADRQALVDQAFEGSGRIGNDLYAIDDSYYNKDIAQRERDLEKARALLADAGQANLEVELITAPLNAGNVEVAQVYAEQAKEAGVTVKIRQLDPAAFYGPEYLKYPFAVNFWGGLSFVLFTYQAFLPDSPYQETHFNDKEFVAAFNAGVSELDEAARREHFNKAQEIFFERSGSLIPLYIDQIDAYAANVVPPPKDKGGLPYSSFRFSEMGFKA